MSLKQKLIFAGLTKEKGRKYKVRQYKYSNIDSAIHIQSVKISIIHKIPT